MAVKRKAGPDPLTTYRAKRSLDRTPEPGAAQPAPAAEPSAGGLFVVHMHAARRLHWDLRLEMDGVLTSWAVPKGPSPNPADKRLAVHVEDHPLEYGDFEGLIPEGNYGAGAVIVWDRGRWVPLEDPHEGMRRGAARHGQRPRHRGGVPRDCARPHRAPVRRVHLRWRAGGDGRGGAAHVPAIADPRQDLAGARSATRRRRGAGDVVRIRPARVRGIRPPAGAAREAHGVARADRTARGSDQIPRALPDRRRDDVPAGDAARARGLPPQDGGLTVSHR